MMAKAMEHFEPYHNWTDIFSSNLSLHRIGSYINIDTSFNIKDNKVYIDEKNGIVHTKSYSLPGLYIVPMEKGVFKATVSLMCAEYDEPEKIELNIICD